MDHRRRVRLHRRRGGTHAGQRRAARRGRPLPGGPDAGSAHPRAEPPQAGRRRAPSGAGHLLSRALPGRRARGVHRAQRLVGHAPRRGARPPHRRCLHRVGAVLGPGRQDDLVQLGSPRRRAPRDVQHRSGHPGHHPAHRASGGSAGLPGALPGGRAGGLHRRRGPVAPAAGPGRGHVPAGGRTGLREQRGEAVLVPRWALHRAGGYPAVLRTLPGGTEPDPCGGGGHRRGDPP